MTAYAESRPRRNVQQVIMCPVPGCGSTFTHTYNLRGHLTTGHSELLAYQCKWPGCAKRFVHEFICKDQERRHQFSRSSLYANWPMSSTAVDGLYRQRERQSSNAACASLLATAPPHTMHPEDGIASGVNQAASQLASVRLREVGLPAPETEFDNGGWPRACL